MQTPRIAALLQPSSAMHAVSDPFHCVRERILASIEVKEDTANVQRLAETRHLLDLWRST